MDHQCVPNPGWGGGEEIENHSSLPIDEVGSWVTDCQSLKARRFQEVHSGNSGQQSPDGQEAPWSDLSPPLELGIRPHPHYLFLAGNYYFF